MVATVKISFFLWFEIYNYYICQVNKTVIIMEQAEIQPLYDSYHRKIAKVDLRFKRYLYSQINWKARIIVSLR